MVFCRPTASGSTPPGKKTLLRKGRMGSTAGMSSLLMSPGAAGVTTFGLSDISFSPRPLVKKDSPCLTENSQCSHSDRAGKSPALQGVPAGMRRLDGTARHPKLGLQRDLPTDHAPPLAPHAARRRLRLPELRRRACLAGDTRRRLSAPHRQ